MRKKKTMITMNSDGERNKCKMAIKGPIIFLITIARGRVPHFPSSPPAIQIPRFGYRSPSPFFFFRSLIVQMTTAEANALESIPADQQGSFSSFLKTLASFTGDLSSLTCPSFLLAPISLLEYS